MSHSRDSASCQNSPCFQCEDTIGVVLASWPRNSWLSVSLNTRVTLLMGWWKLAWCQCWIHSNMFTQQRYTCCETVELNLDYTSGAEYIVFFFLKLPLKYHIYLINKSPFHDELIEYTVSYIPPTTHFRPLLCACVFSPLFKHNSETSRTLFSILWGFPFGHGVLVEIKMSSPSVSGKDKGVFLWFSDSVHVFLVPPLPLKQSQ